MKMRNTRGWWRLLVVHYRTLLRVNRPLTHSIVFNKKRKRLHYIVFRDTLAPGREKGQHVSNVLSANVRKI